jgi:organic radical activating enzyme
MVTFKCNWFCDFCAVDTHSKSNIDFDDVLSKIDLIDSNSEVSISGGEPGLLSEHNMETIIQKLVDKNCEINVNTNGTFFRSFYSNHFIMSNVNCFLFHCSEHLDDIISLPNISNDIEFLVVVSDKNYPLLDSFISNNPSLRPLSIFGADQYFVNGKLGPTLSKFNSLKIYQKYKDILSKNSISYLFDKCSYINNELVIL